jgi:phage repressor protein C with HTH and peptisase S24 domain
MMPSLRPGQLVLFVSRPEVRTGDVVMVQHNGLEKIKRVEQQGSSRIYIVGDNPAASTDSRQFGWIEKTSVIATLVFPRLKS